MDWQRPISFFPHVNSDERKEGFKAFIWVNKLIDGLIDGENKSPIISSTARLSGAVSSPI